jgi:hypothetical protein
VKPQNVEGMPSPLIKVTQQIQKALLQDFLILYIAVLHFAGLLKG